MLDRQRQAERKQQEVEREAERKRKYMGGGASAVRIKPMLYQNNIIFRCCYLIFLISLLRYLKRNVVVWVVQRRQNTLRLLVQH